MNTKGIIIVLLIGVLLFGCVQDLNDKLIAASTNGTLQEVISLIDKGADVNAKNEYNETPLQWAAPFFKFT